MSIVHKILWILILCLGLYSCKQHFSRAPSNGSMEKDKISEGIVILLLNIASDNGHYSVSITNSRIIETKKEVDNNKSERWNKNDFVCFVLDEGKNIMDTLLIVQPLHTRFEYPGDENAIGSKVIEHQDNDVLLRFSYSSHMKYLRIEKVGEYQQLRLVDILEIPKD